MSNACHTRVPRVSHACVTRGLACKVLKSTATVLYFKYFTSFHPIFSMCSFFVFTTSSFLLQFRRLQGYGMDEIGDLSILIKQRL